MAHAPSKNKYGGGGREGGLTFGRGTKNNFISCPLINNLEGANKKSSSFTKADPPPPQKKVLRYNFRLACITRILFLQSNFHGGNLRAPPYRGGETGSAPTFGAIKNLPFSYILHIT